MAKSLVIIALATAAALMTPFSLASMVSAQQQSGSILEQLPASKMEKMVSKHG